jgi:uncharacterized membrane protein
VGPTFWSLLILVGIPALIVWGVVTLSRLSRGSGNRNPAPPDPTAILKVRLARGEIDTEEYERLRGFIGSDW